MYSLKANFYPASNPSMGYIGKASVIIGNAIRVNNISVFEKAEPTGCVKRNISFDTFNNGKNSYVIPANKEAHQAILDVIFKAVTAEKHFAIEKGDFAPNLTVNGAKVNEPYADGRYSVDVGGFVTLNGLSTRVVEYAKDGKDKSFVAVDIPAVRDGDGNIRKYTDKEGAEHVNLQFEGLVDAYKNKEGEEVKKDYGLLMTNLVKGKRKELLTPSLDDKIAEGKAAQFEAPVQAEAPTYDVPSR